MSNENVFNDVAVFCQQATQVPEPDPGVAANEVPTALLLTGINTPDHDTVFGSLVARLKVRGLSSDSALFGSHKAKHPKN